MKKISKNLLAVIFGTGLWLLMIVGFLAENNETLTDVILGN